MNGLQIELHQWARYKRRAISKFLPQVDSTEGGQSREIRGDERVDTNQTDFEEIRG